MLKEKGQSKDPKNSQIWKNCSAQISYI